MAVFSDTGNEKTERQLRRQQKIQNEFVREVDLLKYELSVQYIVKDWYIGYVLDKSVELYTKWCDLQGAVYQEPNRSLSSVGYKYAYLRNVAGIIAKINLKTGEVV